MGTHPIFESDFDCLTDVSESDKGTLTRAILRLNGEPGVFLHSMHIAGSFILVVLDWAHVLQQSSLPRVGHSISHNNDPLHGNLRSRWILS